MEASPMATYDQIIKGGTVIDPTEGWHDVLDVGIADGKTSAVGADLPTFSYEQIPGGPVSPMGTVRP